jgi:succinate dehydrogenase / fumarate reductase membrane anchor subunit
MDSKTISNPHNHYGDPKAATRHFIVQRLTGALNVLFMLFLIWVVTRLAGAERAEMVTVVGHPVVAIILGLLIINVSIHMRIGMGEVIDDYVHDERLHSLSMLLNNFFALAVALLTVAALLKLAFGG